MLFPELHNREPLLAAALAITALLLPACKISHDPEKVDIRTPLGGLQVRTDADPRDVGLAVYPGARRQAESSGRSDKHSANVNISSSLFGVKVVAVEYESDDPASKLVDYYKKELAKYGKVLECAGSGGEGGVDLGGQRGKSKELTCDQASGGSPQDKSLELKAGTSDKQHLVAIEPRGKGCKFALVYVQTRGAEETI